MKKKTRRKGHIKKKKKIKKKQRNVKGNGLHIQFHLEKFDFKDKKLKIGI